MDERKLKLVGARGGRRTGPRGSAWVGLLGAFLLGGATLATVAGADRARRSFSPREFAVETLQQALERGAKDETVRERLLQFRRVLGRRPLDTRTRVLYASLLLSLSTELSDRIAPAFHARLAAKLSPVTVPVVRLAALVLANSADQDEACSLIREMFRYDQRAAARLLHQAEFFLREEQIESAIPETPGAWLAWSRLLRSEGRAEDGDAWLERAHARWPESLPVLEQLALEAARKKDWETLRRLVPPDRELPRTREAAALLAHRALVRGLDQRIPEARADLEAALRLAGDRIAVQILAGDAYASMGDPVAARRLWNRALHRMGNEPNMRRLRLLLRLARLEHEHGEAAAALRLWRAVLEIDPDHAESRRRIEELTGVRY